MSLDPVGHRVAVTAGEGTAEECHHARIGIHRGECVAVLDAPMAQLDTVAAQDCKGLHRPEMLHPKTGKGESGIDLREAAVRHCNLEQRGKAG
ncbi:MAG TPA: hypothetical protein VFQ87_09030 [Bradyrhizobium sp.]|nr:hypothetical protein [Bradyrhizobium sp.]